MIKGAYIFPGQGAQYVGMGEDLYCRFPQAKEVFEQANSLLGYDLAGLMFKGPLEELTRTVNCQVAVFTASVACLRAFQATHSSINITYTAGLSLGEYSALVAAGALNFEKGLKLVRIRAQSMEEAGRQNPGGMLCLIGLSLAVVEEISRKAEVEIANLNCPGQIVISGSFPALDKAKQLAQRVGVKKVVLLNVSGAFHSSLMAQASRKLTTALEQVEVHPPRIPVVSNVTAEQEHTPREIRDNLARQITSGTRWEDSIRFISMQEVKYFLEIGPGKVLKGLLRKINPQLTVYNIESAQDLLRWKVNGESER